MGDRAGVNVTVAMAGCRPENVTRSSTRWPRDIAAGTVSRYRPSTSVTAESPREGIATAAPGTDKPSSAVVTCPVITADSCAASGVPGITSIARTMPTSHTSFFMMPR